MASSTPDPTADVAAPGGLDDSAFPREPRTDLSNPVKAIAIPLAVAAVTVIVLGFVSPSYSLATLIAIYSIAAIGCNLLLGYTGLLSFGQGAFFGMAAYTAGLTFVHLKWQVPSALLAGALVGMLTAALIGYLAIMQRGVYFVMLTFAFAGMFAYLVFVFPGLTGGENGLSGFPSPLSFGMFGMKWFSLGSAQAVYWFCAIGFVAVYVALSMVVRSRFGAALMAIRENDGRAAAIGYHTTMFKLVAFVISGLVTGFAGGLYTIYLNRVDPGAIHVTISTTILIMTVLGGTGSLYGSFLGAAVYLVLQEVLAQVLGESTDPSSLSQRWQIVLGFALLAIVLFFRGGVWGLIALIGGKLQRLRKRSDSGSDPAEVTP